MLMDINEEWKKRKSFKIAKGLENVLQEEKWNRQLQMLYLSKDHHNSKRYLYRLRLNRRSSYRKHGNQKQTFKELVEDGKAKMLFAATSSLSITEIGRT